VNEPPVTNDDPANPAPPVAVEIAAGDRLSGDAGGGDTDHAPAVELIGERVGDSDRSGMIALFSVGVALSILVHAAFLGAGLLHLPLHAPANEEALPVTIVPDQAQPETQPQPPAPQTPPAAEKPKLSIPETSAPPQPPKPPAPQTQQTQPDKPSAPPPPPPSPAPALAAAPPAAAVPPAAPPANVGPAEGVIADKGAEGAAAELGAAIKRCWKIPSGWTNPHQVTVALNVKLDRSGALASRPVLLEFSANDLGMAAAKNALAAVARCAPYKLPPDKFSQWRETQVRLAPE
jgi:hypothetical protein